MIVTIRIIRSFEYRNIRSLVLKEVEETMTIGELKALIKKQIFLEVNLVPLRGFVDKLDTLSIFHIPGRNKPNTLTLGLEEGEEHPLADELTLIDAGIVSETELSYFNMADFLAFRAAPVTKW